MTHCKKCESQGACRVWIGEAAWQVGLEIIWMDTPSIIRYIRGRVRRGDYDSDTGISEIVEDIKHEATK